MKIVATIEARMSSSRLPGKVLLKAGGKTMIEHLIARIRAVPSVDEIVLATTTNDLDKSLVSISDELGISCFQGDENDVMGRVINAAESVGGDIVVEITGDCPLIDPNIIEQTIQIFLENKVDYVSNAHVRSYPDGMDSQVFRLETLKKSYSMTEDILDREHVTLHIRNNPDIFTRINLIAPPEIFWPELGLTLDEENDYNLIKKIIEYFGEDNCLFSCLDTIKLLKKSSHWVSINSNVTRKEDT